MLETVLTSGTALSSELVDTLLRACGLSVGCCPARDCSLELTIAHAMTNSIAIGALNDGMLSLDLHLRAGGSRVAVGITVVTPSLSVLGRLASIAKPGEVLRRVLGEESPLARTGSLVTEAVAHNVLLVTVTLHVHQGKGREEVGLLNGHEEERNVLAAQCLLQLQVGHVRVCLDVLLDAGLGVVNVSGGGGIPDALPRDFSVDSLDVGSINFARSLAIGCHMT